MRIAYLKKLPVLWLPVLCFAREINLGLMGCVVL
jgi:hypothetical protein